jgi:hypothetical protein
MLRHGFKTIAPQNTPAAKKFKRVDLIRSLMARRQIARILPCQTV